MAISLCITLKKFAATPETRPELSGQDNATTAVKSENEPMTLPAPAVGQSTDLTTEKVLETTTFAGEEKDVEVHLERATKPHSCSGTLDVKKYTLEEWMARPTKMNTITWASSVNPIASDYEVQTSPLFDPNSGSLLYEFKAPWDVFAIDRVKREKIQNFSFFRASLKIKVVVNNQNFQQGALLVVFNPYAQLFDEVGTSNPLESQRGRSCQHRSGLTSMHHVILNLESREPAILTVPFCTPYDGYPMPLLDSGTWEDSAQQGVVQIYVLNSLTAATASTVDVTVFAWFEDVDLSVPTGKPTIVPSLRERYPAGEPQYKRRYKAQMGLSAMAASAIGGISSSLTSSLVDEASERTTNFVGNIVDKGLSAVEKIPVVGNIAKPVSWVAKKMNPLNWFGNSKPQTKVAPCFMINRPGQYAWQLEGTDNGEMLATVQDAEVAPHQDTFATQEDEMLISKLVNTPAIVNRVQNWDITQTPGTQLIDIPVEPVRVQNNVTNDSFGPIISYIASMFGFWRGSLKYKFQFIKSPNHYGRVRAVFVPFVDTPPPEDESDFSSYYNVIFDLRDGYEFTMEIPYISPTIWKQVRRPLVNQTDSNAVGRIYLYVMNALRAPNLCSDSIDINVWLCAGDDFDLAVPLNSINIPTVWDPPEPRQKKMVAQMGMETASKSQQPSTGRDQPLETRSSVKIKSCQIFKGMEPNINTIGEKVTTLKTLIQRPSAPSLTNINEIVSYTFRPNYFRPGSWLYVVSWLYRFWVGSVRRKVLFSNRPGATDDGYEKPVYIGLSNVSAGIGGSDGIGSVISYPGQTAMMVQIPRLNPVAEFTIPYYGNTRFRIIGSNSQDTFKYDAWMQTKGEVDFDVFTSAGDDFYFGWRIGPPPFRKNN